jgi:hypothetical protein
MLNTMARCMRRSKIAEATTASPNTSPHAGKPRFVVASVGCKPVPEAEAHALAEHYPELTLRTEPAHREAFFAFGPYSGENTTQWQLASEALRTWAAENGIEVDRLALKPEDLGLRITCFVSEPVTETSVPDCDFAVPFMER